jgi:ribonucleoside-diphosphate reductase alpha chain
MKVKKITVTENRAITLDINVDEVHHYILENGLVSHNSSVSGGTTNSVYPIRDYYLNKSNETLSFSYVVPESTKLKDKYEIAWDIDTNHMIDVYAILQKWCDQSLSSDFYRRLEGTDTVTVTEMLKHYIRRHKYGLKTKYYTNSKTSKSIDLNASEGDGLCSSGGCSI